MATVRPQVTVFSAIRPNESTGTLPMPNVMQSPVRSDLVRYVHTNQSKNYRQPHGVKLYAGYETSAESWGTGRAVARIPRVAGGGTHRSGQGAFANMCRGGGMFSPKKTWRRWHRKVNITERRHAIASAIAASAVPGLVMARGHRIDEVRELPIVVSDDFEKFVKTKAAKNLLHELGLKAELDKVVDSRIVRAGRGKMRNRRYVNRRGPLVVYANADGCHRSLRAIPGVDMLNVEALGLLKLAPGGTLGRLVVWTESAFKRVDELFGDFAKGSTPLKNYILHRPVMTNADVSRIINSFEVQSALKPAKTAPKKPEVLRNPLRNAKKMNDLNPAASAIRKRLRIASTPGTAEHKYLQAKRVKVN